MENQNNQIVNLIPSSKTHNPDSSQDSDNKNFEEISSDTFSHFQKPKEKEREKLSQIVPEKPTPKHVESLKKKLERIKSTTKKEAEISNVFEGRKFTFLPYGVDLTLKRIQILSQNMIKKGATIIPPDVFRWSMEKYGDVFVLTSKAMPCDCLLGKVPTIFHQEMAQFTFVDCDWASLCLQKNKYVSPEFYCNEVLGYELTVLVIKWNRDYQTTSNRKQTKQSEKEKRIDINRKLEIIGATFFDEETFGKKVKGGSKDAIQIESENDSIADTVIIGGQSEEDNNAVDGGDDSEIKIELQLKKEPQNSGKRNFSFLLDGDEEQEEPTKRIKVKADESLKKVEEIGPIKKENLKMEEEKDQTRSQKLQILPFQNGKHPNLNTHLTSEFEKMLKVVQIEHNQGRVHAYGKAISVLKTLPFKVKSAKEVANISGLGKRMVKLIEEILKTGKIGVAEKALKNENAQVLQLFYSIFGVGPNTALSWYNKGMRKIEDLKRNPYLLNHEQKICVKYYEEFLKKIPRDIATEIFNIVREKIEMLSDYPGQYEVVCAGSYRRGREFCGDVDIIASPVDCISSKGLCLKLVQSLEGDFLTDQLSLRVSDDLEGETYYGVCYYKGMHRRIDFKICDRERFGPLLTYYTGSEYFNRTLRQEAEKRGFKLHNFGIFPLIKVGDQKQSGKLIPCPTEQDLFRILGLKFIQPEFRDV